MITKIITHIFSDDTVGRFRPTILVQLPGVTWTTAVYAPVHIGIDRFRLLHCIKATREKANIRVVRGEPVTALFVYLVFATDLWLLVY